MDSQPPSEVWQEILKINLKNIHTVVLSGGCEDHLLLYKKYDLRKRD